MSTQVFGRTAELDEFARLLDDASAGPVALRMYGAAGAGKSTLVEHACRLAVARGFAVLACRPAESESELSFSGVADLLAGVGTETLAALPAPQRRALDVVLLRADPDPGSEVTEPRAVATALRSVVSALAARAPVLLSVDDLQWLDPASARVLEFALRRLDGERVAVMVSVRGDRSPGSVLGLDRALPPAGRREVAVGPLSLGALHRLVQDAFGHSLARPTLLQLAEVSGGNPFYALEIARALDIGSPHLPGEPLPVPETLRELVSARISALPADTQAALLVVAVAAAPTLDLLEAASGSTMEVLAPAVATEVVEVDGRRLRFTHPLLAAAVRSAARPEELRDMHRVLSAVVDDPEERARHLALGSAGPDEGTAAILEAAAAAARRRAAPDVAAELGQRSLRLTPPDAALHIGRRRLVVAEYLLEAGDAAGARRLLSATLDVNPPPQVYTKALLMLGLLCWFDGCPSQAQAHYWAALQQTRDPILTAKAHAGLALFCDDALEATDQAQRALRLLAAEQAPADRSFALFRYFYCDVLAGRPPRLDLLEEALALEPHGQSYTASLVSGIWAKSIDDFGTARERFLGRLREAAEVGDESTPADVLPHLAELELWAGDWPLARQYAASALVSAEQTGQATERALRVQAQIDAHEGRLDAARAAALPRLDAPELPEGHLTVAMWLALLGFVELSAGRSSEADRCFCQAEERLSGLHIREPLRLRHTGDHIEAILALGELDRAEALLTRLEERGRVVPRPWVTVTAARCRALLSAARGHLDEAVTQLHAAAHGCQFLPMPFEVARTHVVIGQIHRRRREKRAAADALQLALDGFEKLGATSWAERTRAELSRVGLRPAAPLELTETERRVAELVATGRTSRDVASALFLSPKTVEANLSRAYQKLGICSRAELGAVMRERARLSEPDRSH